MAELGFEVVQEVELLGGSDVGGPSGERDRAAVLFADLLEGMEGR
jgi:hypothetical protein